VIVVTHHGTRSTVRRTAQPSGKVRGHHGSPRRRHQRRAQPLQGADVALAGRRRRDAQLVGSLLVGQFLIMTQGENVAIQGSKPSTASWKQICNSTRIAAMLGDVSRPIRLQESDASRPPAGAASPPVSRHASGPPSAAEWIAIQPLPGKKPQPQKQRHRRLGHILLQLACRVQIGLLQHVGRIDPGRHATVQSQVHHAAQPLAMTHEDLGERSLPPILEVFSPAVR